MSNNPSANCSRVLVASADYTSLDPNEEKGSSKAGYALAVAAQPFQNDSFEEQNLCSDREGRSCTLQKNLVRRRYHQRRPIREKTWWRRKKGERTAIGLFRTRACLPCLSLFRVLIEAVRIFL